eukprot:1190424-Prorocentrum_minimum.AAC.1
MPEGLTKFTKDCKREQADFSRMQEAIASETKRMKFQPPWMQSPQNNQATLGSPNKKAIGSRDGNDGVARGLFGMGFNPGGLLRQGTPNTTPTKFQDALEGPFSAFSPPAPPVSPVVLRTRPGTKSPPKAKHKINFTPDKDKDRWTNMAQEAKLIARQRRKEINEERRQLFVENIKSSVQPLLLKH